jgi:Xaa-Pro aminopeptidase
MASNVLQSGLEMEWQPAPFAMAEYFTPRRERLKATLAQEGLDAYVIGQPANVTYLTGFSGESSYLLLGRKQDLVVSDGRFIQQLAEECPGLETHIRPPSQPLIEAVAEVLNKLGFRSVGFESTHMCVADLETLREKAAGIDWKGGPGRVESLRAVKDPSEIDQIREAIHLAQRAFAMFRAMLRPFDTEKELSDALEMYVRRAGGRCTSFPSIVAVGERAALPHAPPTGRRLADADLLLVDWGASGPFYKSDLTRVLVPHRNSAFNRSESRSSFATRLAEVYPVVLRAQERAIRALRPGAVAQDIDAEARAEISAAGFGPFFNHSLGHGLGLQVHEAPMLKAGNQTVLQAGMVVTVEPGIYLPGEGGVRVEDDVLVTPDGCEVLTSVPRDLESMRGEW